MKKVTTRMTDMLLSLALILVLAGCGKQASQETAEEGKETSSPQETSPEMAAYLSLKDALVATDAAAAKDAAKILAGATSGEVMETAQSIATAEDVGAQRESFNTLSQMMYDKVSKEGTKTTLYKQYCPMAFNDTGAFWLSDKQEIRNPYFGDMMLKCGKVEETLTAN